MNLRPLNEEYEEYDQRSYLNYGGQGNIFKVIRKTDKKEFALK